MTQWHAIKLTQARQVAALRGFEDAALPSAADDLHATYLDIRKSGDVEEALAYIGHALPKLEAVAWAAHLIDAQSRKQEVPARERLALDTAMRWLQDPTDQHRRAAYAAAEAAPMSSPEAMLATAIFYAGGSIAPVGMSPVLAPPEACLGYAVGAVRALAYRSGAREAVMEQALQLAEEVAERGLQVFAAA
jgi:hypothetical protein